MKKGQEIILNGKKYKFVEEIKGGGAGTVWKAKIDNEICAIKFLKKENGKFNSNKLKRFQDEIEFCKKYTHPNIIEVIDEGTVNEECFYVMPIYSKTLRHIINDDSIHYTEMLKYLLKIVEAIKYIHHEEIKVIHRDVKPENILIEGEELVLADFGIAHFQDSELTRQGDLLQNRDYQAPEQKRGLVPKSITSAVDIYALGLIINECFTKENPTGTDFLQIADSYPMLYRLDVLVNNMMKQDPGERLKIPEVALELKIIISEAEELISNIKGNLEEDFLLDMDEALREEILNIASVDIAHAKHLWENKTLEEVKKYNHNYNMYIRYNADKFLINLCCQEIVYDICNKKFAYESNTYKSNEDVLYVPLDLKNNEDDVKLYQELQDILKKIRTYPDFDLSGGILKLYASCDADHCKEMVASIKEQIVKIQEELSGVQIIYLIQQLKYYIAMNKEIIESEQIEDHIYFNEEITKDFATNYNDPNLMNQRELSEEKGNQKILMHAKKHWGFSYIKILKNNEYYSIKFDSNKEYSKFKEELESLDNNDYVFEGDVLDILRVNKTIKPYGIIELKPWNSYDVGTTLRKLLKMLKIIEVDDIIE